VAEKSKPRPKPENPFWYTVVNKDGVPVSKRRRRKNGAWANAAANLGYSEHYYDGYEGQEEVIAILKKQGYRIEEKETVRSRDNKGAGWEAKETFLHMRICQFEHDSLERIKHHYRRQNKEATFSWIVRELIAEKIAKMDNDNKNT